MTIHATTPSPTSPTLYMALLTLKTGLYALRAPTREDIIGQALTIARMERSLP